MEIEIEGIKQSNESGEEDSNSSSLSDNKMFSFGEIQGLNLEQNFQINAE